MAQRAQDLALVGQLAEVDLRAGPQPLHRHQLVLGVAARAQLADVHCTPRRTRCSGAQMLGAWIGSLDPKHPEWFQLHLVQSSAHVSRLPPFLLQINLAQPARCRLLLSRAARAGPVPDKSLWPRGAAPLLV